MRKRGEIVLGILKIKGKGIGPTLNQGTECCFTNSVQILLRTNRESSKKY